MDLPKICGKKLLERTVFPQIAALAIYFNIKSREIVLFEWALTQMLNNTNKTYIVYK